MATTNALGHIPLTPRMVTCSESIRQSFIYSFLGYFDPTSIFVVIKMNDFRGELSDISAETATLVTCSENICRRSTCSFCDTVVLRVDLLHNESNHCFWLT